MVGQFRMVGQVRMVGQAVIMSTVWLPNSVGIESVGVEVRNEHGKAK
jgi:hypothetical protein